MIPGAFEYHRPQSVTEAVALLAKLGPEARALAGGHSLIPLMKTRLAAPDHLIDLARIAALKGIRREGETIVIGAMTTEHEIVASKLLGETLPILIETALLIADPQVRYMGTIGGNAANGDPGNDMPAVLQCLNATYRLTGPKGERSVAARAYYKGAYDTARAPDEILTAIAVPLPPSRAGWAYEKLKRKTGDFATAAAAVLLTMSGGRCASASVALTNVADRPLFAEAAGKALVGTTLDKPALDGAAKAASAIADPASDLHGPAEYRKAMAGVMARRAIERAKARAKG